MKKFKMLIVTLLLPFLVACGTTDDRPDAAPVTVTASAESTVDPDEAYADFIRSKVHSVSEDTTEDIISLSETICDSFDRGLTFVEIGTALMDGGAGAAEAGTLIGGSVGYICPEHTDQIPDAEVSNS